MRSNAAQGRRPRKRGGMVARRMGRHAALRGSLVEREDGIRRPAGLERAHLLKIFALEKKRSARSRIETRAGQDRRAMNVRTDAFVRSADCIEIESHYESGAGTELFSFPSRVPTVSRSFTGSSSRRKAQKRRENTSLRISR